MTLFSPPTSGTPLSRDLALCAGAALLLFVCCAAFLSAEDQTVICVMLGGAGVALVLAARFGFADLLRPAIRRNETLWSALMVLTALALMFWFREDHYVLFIVGTILCYAVAVLGLNIQLGHTGVINFSCASFFGIGGYTAAMLLAGGWVPPAVAPFAGGVVAGLVGCLLLLPVLRTSGHYAALVTMAFALLFKVFLEVNEWFGGPQGIPVGGMSLFGVDFGTDVEFGPFTGSFYLRYNLLCLVVLCLAFAFTRRLERSWMGLAMDAVREDETAAACFGVSIARWKITAFTLGNVMSGFSGALYAMMLAYISPANFTFADSLLFLSILLLGGMGSSWGVIAATVVVVVIPEKFQVIQEYRYLLYSALVLLIIIYRPAGMLPRATRRYLGGEA